MGKINIILKAVGIGAAVVVSNINVATAEEPSNSDRHPDNFNSDSQVGANILLSTEALSSIASRKNPKTIADFDQNLTADYLSGFEARFGAEKNSMQYQPVDNSSENVTRANFKGVVLPSPSANVELTDFEDNVIAQPPVAELRQKLSILPEEGSRTSESRSPLAQATPPPEENAPNILESAEEPIENPEILNPNSNPLTFPTQPEEVDVEAPQPITLEQAIELALKNNKEIEVSRLNLERSQEELRQARAALYPTLNSQLQVQNSRSAGGDIAEVEREEQLEENPALQFSEEEVNETSTAFSGSVSFNYDVYAGGGRSADIRRARRQLRFQELDLEAIVEQTRLDTATDYYALQDSDAQVAIQRAAVEDAQQTLRDAQLLEQAGLGTRFEVLQAEVELAEVQQQLTTAVSNQNIARRQLAETLDLGQGVNLRTADAIEQAGDWNFSLAESIVLAYKNRAELEQFLLQREINDAQREIALATIRPQVSVTGSYDLINGFNDDVDQLGDGYTLAALVQWQFFDGGAARAIADQEETDIDLAETQFADQRNLVRFEVEQAFFGLEANRENIDTATRGVELAEESLRLARLRFQAGVGTQTDVIDAQTALTQARGDLVTAIVNYNQSLAQIRRAVTNLPDNGLFDLP